MDNYVVHPLQYLKMHRMILINIFDINLLYIYINPYPTIFIANPISSMFDLNYKHTLEIYFLPPMHDMKETKTK